MRPPAANPVAGIVTGTVKSGGSGSNVSGRRRRLELWRQGRLGYVVVVVMVAIVLVLLR
jgi:hypothetical protein